MEWISVEERLPDVPGKYIVSGKWRQEAPQIWMCEFLNIGGLRGWSNDARNPIVAFWMPLPPPPATTTQEGGRE